MQKRCWRIWRTRKGDGTQELRTTFLSDSIGSQRLLAPPTLLFHPSSLPYLVLRAANFGRAAWMPFGEFHLIVFKDCLHKSNESYSPHSHVAGLLRLLVLHSEFLLWADHVALLIFWPWAGLRVGPCHTNSVYISMSHLRVSHLGEDETSLSFCKLVLTTPYIEVTDDQSLTLPFGITGLVWESLAWLHFLNSCLFISVLSSVGLSFCYLSSWSPIFESYLSVTVVPSPLP